MNAEYIADTVEKALRVYEADKRDKTFLLKNYLTSEDGGGQWVRYKEDKTVIYDYMRK